MTALDPSPPAWQTALRTGLRCLLLALPLWLGLLHLPAPFSIEIFDARSMALDYAVRHGIGLGTTLPSSTGPLGALLTSVHSGESLWLSYWIQSLVALSFALGLSWTVWRVAAPARWWLLGAFLAVASFRAEYVHISLLLLGGMMFIGRPVNRWEAAGIGFVFGLLALINVTYAWLTLAGILLGCANSSTAGSRQAPFLAGVTLVTVVLFGWFWCGQPGGELLPWLGHGLWPAPLRHQASADYWPGSVLAWGLASGGVMTMLLAGTVITAQARWRSLAVAGFVLVVLALVWRDVTGQPEIRPQVFFVAVLMAGTGWLALEISPPLRRWSRPAGLSAMILASCGLMTVEPRILTESIILLNHKVVVNASALIDRRGWQRPLNNSFRSASQLFSLPRITAATAGQRTDLLGNAIGYALANRMDYAPRPGLQSYLVTDAALSARDAAYYSDPSAPHFVVQRLQAFDRGLPALEDAAAQMALYSHYDFQFEENGFVLWQRRPGSGKPRSVGTPVWQAKADWDQPIALPVRPGRAYWVSLRVSRSLFGWLKYHLLPPADPTLVLRDGDGGTLSYRAAPTALATGFLLNPLFRGEIDLVRYQAAEKLPMIHELTLQKPLHAPGDFAGSLELFLHEVPAPAVAGHTESARNLAQRFRISNRLPVAVAAYFPPQVSRLGSLDVLLSHPDSSIEFPVRTGDTLLEGKFGLLDGAYQNGNATDGVEFVMEYVPAKGSPTILWRRHLDPVLHPGDRGLQVFSVTLPQPASGRVILRTQNLPGHNAAWDWSLWTDLRFGPTPATK